MTPDPSRLYDLLVGLFRSPAELQRFLVLEGYPVERMIQVTKGGNTLSYVAQQAATGLVELGLADDKLFAALRARTPDRASDIDAVQRSLRGDEPEAGGAEPPESAPPPPAFEEPLSEEAESFRRALRADLAELTDLDPLAGAHDRGHWPWTGAAAVLGAFRPAPLPSAVTGTAEEPALSPLPGPKPSAPAPVALAAYVRPVADGRWMLRDDVRIPCLRRLLDEDLLDTALAANETLPDPRRDAISTVISGDQVSLYSLEAAQLDDLDVVLGWLEELGVSVPLRRVDIHSAAERRRLIDPLRRLVGEYFRGRVGELATLRAHIRSTSATDAVLWLHGPGGVGKSSLIGRLLLDLEEQASHDPVPYAYLDFDRAIHNPHDPLALVEQIARQLRLLFAGWADVAQFAALEGLSANDNVVRSAEVLQIEPGLDLKALIEVLAQRLRELHGGRPDAAPLVLVLDTFEEVQAKGPGAVHEVLALVQRLQEALPGTRGLIAGRSLLGLAGPRGPLVLGDLDVVSADAVLLGRGVTDPGIRSLIMERFGRNPLTLRLAAEAMSRLGSAEAAFAGVVAQADALAEVALEQIQGMLYSRILGHLHDLDVIRVAHPGLAVRLVTVEVLREVLAEPCGLDPARAGEIFDKLRAEVSMFELRDDQVLQHRQDVRQLMLRAMVTDAKLAPLVAAIHRRAAAYYRGKPGAPARAEELYHRLMSDEDPRTLDGLWTSARPVGRPPSLDEPMAKRARVWLERRLGLAPADDRSDWAQEDWEAEAADRATSWLASGAPEQALAVLDERADRIDGSRLPALEVAAATAVGDLDRADRVLTDAMPRAIHDEDRSGQLALAEQAVVLRARSGDLDGLVEAARAAATLADLTGDRVGGVESLLRAVVALREHDQPDAAASLAAMLAQRFRTFDRAALWADPGFVCRVLRGAGPIEPGVLLHAAEQVGEHPEVFLPDAYVLARLLSGTTEAAAPELRVLARAVGLAESDGRDLDPVELASRAIRVGRIGDVIRIGLDTAEDIASASELVAGQLVQDVDRRGK